MCQNIFFKVKYKLPNFVPPTTQKKTQCLIQTLDIAYIILGDTQKAASFEWDPEQEGDLQWTQAAVQATLLRAYGLADPVMLEASAAVKDTLWSKSSASP